MNIRQSFNLINVGKIGGASLIILFIVWFAVTVASGYKKDQADYKRVLADEFKNRVETCVMLKDVGAWMESKPVPDQYRIDCKAAVIADNPFRYQDTAWQRFTARVAYLFN